MKKDKDGFVTVPGGFEKVSDAAWDLMIHNLIAKHGVSKLIEYYKKVEFSDGTSILEQHKG